MEEPLHSSVIRSGFLTKRGAFVKTWKKRWFVLFADPPRLAYYRKRDSESAAGEIKLDLDTLAYHLIDGDPTHPFSFKIQTKDRTFEIFADSRVEMQDWIEDVMKCAGGQYNALAKSINTLQEEEPDVKEQPWIKFTVRGMWCEHCWELIPIELKKIPGVDVVRVDAGADLVAVRRSEPVANKVMTELAKLGFLVEPYQNPAVK